MNKRAQLQVEQSEKRQRVNELLAIDELTDEQRTELDTLTKRLQQIEPGTPRRDRRGSRGREGDPRSVRQRAGSTR